MDGYAWIMHGLKKLTTALKGLCYARCFGKKWTTGLYLESFTKTVRWLIYLKDIAFSL